MYIYSHQSCVRLLFKWVELKRKFQSISIFIDLLMKLLTPILSLNRNMTQILTINFNLYQIYNK